MTATVDAHRQIGGQQKDRPGRPSKVQSAFVAEEFLASIPLARRKGRLPNPKTTARSPTAEFDPTSTAP